MFQALLDTDFSSEKQVKSTTKSVINSINGIFQSYNISLDYDGYIFLEVLKKTKSDLEKISQDMDNHTPELYKQYGIFAYWVKRLKPFSERSTRFENYTNEAIIFIYGFSKINQYIDKEKRLLNLPEEYVNNIVYLIRFEQISKCGLMAIFSSIFEAK